MALQGKRGDAEGHHNSSVAGVSPRAPNCNCACPVLAHARREGPQQGMQPIGSFPVVSRPGWLLSPSLSGVVLETTHHKVGRRGIGLRSVSSSTHADAPRHRICYRTSALDAWAISTAHAVLDRHGSYAYAIAQRIGGLYVPHRKRCALLGPHRAHIRCHRDPDMAGYEGGSRLAPQRGAHGSVLARVVSLAFERGGRT